MNYLKDEIDEALKALALRSRKLEPDEVEILIHSLTKKLFKSESHVLDPVEINEKHTEHNSNFWQEIQYCINRKNP